MGAIRHRTVEVTFAVDDDGDDSDGRALDRGVALVRALASLPLDKQRNLRIVSGTVRLRAGPR